MNESDKQEFYDTLVAICELYSQPKPKTPMVDMYFNTLGHISIADFKAGLNIHARDTDQGQYFPKPADVLRNIQGNKATQAEQAWSKVDKAIRCIGPHETIVFDDGLIHAVIDDMGGWVTLCAVDDSEYPFKHNEFIKRYQGFINKAPANIPRKLIGSTEGYNESKGFKVPPPRLIGDVQKAILVLESGSDSKRIGITPLDQAIGGIQKRLE